MYTRTFIRTSYGWSGEHSEQINISEYGFEWFVDGELSRSGLVENLEETIEMLIDEGFEEVE